jgi:hypothetical protein
LVLTRGVTCDTVPLSFDKPRDRDHLERGKKVHELAINMSLSSLSLLSSAIPARIASLDSHSCWGFVANHVVASTLVRKFPLTNNTPSSLL